MAVAFQLAIPSQAIWDQELKQTPGYLQIVDAHQSWCGPSKPMQSSFRKVYLEHGDKAAIKFYTARQSRIPFLHSCLPGILPPRDPFSSHGCQDC